MTAQRFSRSVGYEGEGLISRCGLVVCLLVVGKVRGISLQGYALSNVQRAAGRCSRSIRLKTGSAHARAVNHASIPANTRARRTAFTMPPPTGSGSRRGWRNGRTPTSGSPGRRSGIFVLDVDGNVGNASLEALQDKHGRIPKTVTVKTGKGRHHYLRGDGARVGNSAGRLGKGIDVRGDGGYVVAAGSVHASGAIYRYVDGRGLEDIEVASAPKWLIDLISAPKSTDSVAAEPTVHQIPAADVDRAHAYADAARRREFDRLGKAPIHQRNDTLNKAAFKLGQLAPYSILNMTEVADDLARVAREVGLDDHEIGPTIQSGLQAGSQHPRRLPFLKSRDRIRTVEPPEKSDDDLATELAKLGTGSRLACLRRQALAA